MNTEILCFCKNENDLKSLYSQCSILSNELGCIGININNITCGVKDLAEAKNEIALAASRATVIFIVGGVGESCVGKNALAQFLNIGLTKNEIAIENMQRYCRINSISFKNDWADSMLLPEGAAVLPGADSGFSGFCTVKNGKMFVVLPTENTNFSKLLRESILPYSIKQLGIFCAFATVKAFGQNKAYFKQIIAPLKTDGLHIECNFNCGVADINLYATAKTQQDCDSICEDAILKLKDALGDDLFCIGSKSIADTAVSALLRNNLTVATAESCTGGMISGAITAVSGASGVLEMGICAYSNRIKEQEVGVPAEIIEKYGAVSSQTALYLAKGAKKAGGADIGIGVTGVAGPAMSEGKPVGTVYIGIHDGTNGWVISPKTDSSLSRDEIRETTTNTALDAIRRYIAYLPDVMPGIFAEDEYLTQDFGDNKTEEEKELPLNLSDGFFINAENAEASYQSDEDFAEQFYKEYLSEEKQPAVKKVKAKKKTATVLKLVLFLASAIVLAGTIFLVSYFSASNKEQKTINSAKATYYSDNGFNLLKAQNADFKGWIKIDGTKIDLPVYQTTDNSFYSSHNLQKKKSRYGAIYFDSNNSVGSDNQSRNLVIYGKNMNDGAQFGTLNDYTDINFYRNHSKIILNTGYGDKTYTVFAVMIMNAKKTDDNGYLFNFMRSQWSDTVDFESWKTELTERNLYTTDIQLSETDNLITLVTTSKAFDNARLIIMAKESDNGILQNEITVNAHPRYPQAWYDKRNLKNPFIND